MNKIKLIMVVLALVTGLNVNAQKSEEKKKENLVWYSSLEKASEVSKRKGKPIFAFFTGSDWCGWCHKLQRNVFAKPAFIAWAKANVVLLELDYPRRKRLSPKLAKQNAELQQAFRVTGYPTIWIFTMQEDSVVGKHLISALGKCGYPRGGTPGKEEDKFIADANAILANKK